MASPASQLRRFHLRIRQYCVLGVGCERYMLLSRGGRFRGTVSRPANPVSQDVIDTAAWAAICRSVVGPARPDPSPPLSGHLPTVGWDQIFFGNILVFVATTLRHRRRLQLQPYCRLSWRDCGGIGQSSICFQVRSSARLVGPHVYLSALVRLGALHVLWGRS